MSTAPYTVFAVAGGRGVFSTHLIADLVAHGAHVIVLTRGDGADITAGATARTVDYSDDASLVSALQGVDVVIATHPGAPALDSQLALVEAAKKARVKLFVPSEFGVTSTKVPFGTPLDHKKEVQACLKALGLPYTLFFSGIFTDWGLIPPFGFDIANKTISFVGEGKTQFSLISRPDVARFVAHILTHLPSSELEGKAFAVEGDKKSYVELASDFEEVYGGKFTIDRDTRGSVEDAEKRAAQGGPNAFFDWFQVVAEKGWIDVGKNDNDLVAGFEPLDVKASLRKWYS